MSEFPIVYLPIELRSRELDSKALLAAVLASRGYCVVFGQQWMFYQHIPRLPPGAVLFKSLNAILRPATHVAHRARHKVVVLEEELLTHIDKKLVSDFLIEGVFDVPQTILSHGDFEKEILSERANGKVDFTVTGNGRVDILKPGHRSFFARDIEAVRAKFGDFVLINTNFGVTNTIWQSMEQVTQIQVKAGYLNPDDPASLRAWEEQIAFERANKEAILTTVKELSRRRPGQRIVLRPHPAEALERWKGVFDDFSNVTVVREGAHVPWTMACRLLLHTSCTTGFEAQVAGKMAMTLIPRPNWISDSFLSNHINPAFADPIAMVDAAEAYLDGREIGVRGRLTLADAAYYVWNIDQSSGVARIADVLTEGLPAPGRTVALPALQHVERPDTLKAKFSLSLQECTDVLQRILNIIGPTRPLNLTHIGDSLFYLTPKT